MGKSFKFGWAISFFLGVCIGGARQVVQAAPDAPARTLKICVAADAPAAVRQAAQAVLQGVANQPLLALMAGSSAPTELTDTAALLDAPAGAQAFSHLVVVGLPTDPLVQAVWQHEARVEGGGFYVFGFGHLQGDIGAIESDRNPFLHGWAIKSAPYETEIVTITGSTPAGVALAAQAFLKEGLVNGVVAGAGWKRASTTILDRDPPAADFTLPAWLPEQVAGATKIGVTEASEDEYRGVLDDTGVEPLTIWRVKYYVPGAWDGAGVEAAIDDYSAGLQRRAYGNTLWCARFASAAEAAEAEAKIADAAHLHAAGKGRWEGAQPAYSSEKSSPGPLCVWTRGEWVFMSTLPKGVEEGLAGTGG